MNFKGEYDFDATPNPRRWQFGLRTSLVLLAVVPMALGLLARFPTLGGLAVVTAACFIGGMAGISAPNRILPPRSFWIEAFLTFVVFCGIMLLVASKLLTCVLLLLSCEAFSHGFGP